MQSIGLGGNPHVVCLQHRQKLKALFHFFNHSLTFQLVLTQPWQKLSTTSTMHSSSNSRSSSSSSNSSCNCSKSKVNAAICTAQYHKHVSNALPLSISQRWYPLASHQPGISKHGKTTCTGWCVTQYACLSRNMPVYNIGYNIATNIDIVLSTFYNFFQHTLEHVNEVTEFLIHRSRATVPMCQWISEERNADTFADNANTTAAYTVSSFQTTVMRGNHGQGKTDSIPCLLFNRFVYIWCHTISTKWLPS